MPAPFPLDETDENRPHVGDRVGRVVRPGETGTVRTVVMPDYQSGQPMWAYVEWDVAPRPGRFRQRPADLYLLPVEVTRRPRPASVLFGTVAAAAILLAALAYVFLAVGARTDSAGLGTVETGTGVPTPFVLPVGSSSTAPEACAPNECLPR